MPLTRFGKVFVGATLGSSVYLFSAWYAYKRHRSRISGVLGPSPQPSFDPATASHITSANAAHYDRAISWDETFMFMGFLRRGLVKQVHGNVLEVSAGTGRNLPYYRGKKIQYLALTDSNPDMLAVLKGKLKGIRYVFPANVCKQDVLALSYPDETYHAVVDTFGLCACEDPVRALSEMVRVTKRGGRIYLLEHGKGKYAWLNEYLDENSEGHYQQWGCVWNRDIEALVRGVRGVKMIKSQRFHFGTTFRYVLEKT